MPVLVLCAAVVALGVLFLGRAPSAPARQATETRPTTFSPDPNGTRAMYLVLAHFLPGTGRWMKPMQGLEAPDAGPSTLLVLQPTVALVDAEVRVLDNWVSKGGQLIIATDRPWRMEGAWKPPDYLARHGLRIGSPSAEARRYDGEGGSLVLAASPLSGRWLDALFTGPEGMVGAVRHVGAGRIILITDPHAWSNARLKESNNAAWLVLAAGSWKNGRLLVDEYHLGYTGGRSSLQLILAFLGTYWGMAVLQLGLAAALYLLARVRHFGPARDLPRERVQDPLERIRGIAAFLQAARAREFSAQAIAQLAGARRYTHRKESNT